MINRTDIFTSEEKYIINKALFNEDKKNFSIDKMLNIINFTLDGSNDDLITEQYSALKYKLLNELTDGGWNNILRYIPFDVPFDDE